MKPYSLLFHGSHSGVIRQECQPLPYTTTSDTLACVDAARKTIEQLGGTALKFVGYVINRRVR